MNLTRVVNLFVCFISINYVYAVHKLPGTSSAVSDLWSNFELQIEDAVFEALDRPTERSRRAPRGADGDRVTWTGFIPNLYQLREQLVIDSFHIASITPACDIRDGTKYSLDAIELHRHHYVTSTCGDILTLYRIHDSSSDLILLESLKLSGEAVKLTHVKMISLDTGEVQLLHLILTANRIEIYRFINEKLELYRKEELLHAHSGLNVYQLKGAVYCLLIKKTSDGMAHHSIYGLKLDNDSITFNWMFSKVLESVSTVRMSTVHDKIFMFQSTDQNQLGVYTFDGHEFRSYQTIDSSNLTDFACFHIGSTHYLALISSGSLRVLKFVDGLFKLIQSPILNGVSSISPIMPPTYRDETFLMVHGPGFVDTLLLSPHSLTFQPSHSNCSISLDLKLPTSLNAADASCLSGLGNLDLSSSVSFKRDHQVTWLLPIDGSVVLINIEAHLQTVPSPVIEQLSKIQEKVESSESTARDMKARSKSFSKVVDGIVLYDTDVRIEGSWKVETLVAPSVPVPNSDPVDFNRDIWMNGLDTIVQYLNRRVDELEKLIGDIENRLERSIRNGTMDDVEFDKLVIEGTLLMNQLEVLDMNLEQLNGLNFNEFAADVVQLNADKIMESLKIIGTLTTDALTAERVNTISVSDAATLDSDIQLEGGLVINSDVQVDGNVNVDGTINGLNFSNQLMTPDVSFGTITFTENVIVDEITIEGRLDNVDVGLVLPNVVYNRSTTVGAEFGPIRFDNLIIEGDIDIITGMIENVDLLALNSSVVRLNADETLLEGSAIDFQNGVVVESETFFVLESINQVPITDFLLKNTDLKDITMNGQKTFEGLVTVRDITVDGLINGHRLEDAFTLDTNQSVSGAVNLLSGFNATENDLHIGTLNGADWQIVMEKGVHPALLAVPGENKNVSVRGQVTLGGILFSQHLKVPEESDDLISILDDLVYHGDENLIITGTKTLPSVDVKDMKVNGKVNGYRLLDDVLTLNTNQIITGHYRLENAVEFSSLNITGRLNDYVVDQLLGNVQLFDGVTPLTLTNRFRFDLVSVLSHFSIEGSVNGIKTERMVQQGVDQTFTAHQTLISPVFNSNLSINGNLKMLNVNSRFNDIDLDIFDRRRVTLSTDQWISGSWTVNQANISSLSFQTLNGLTVDQWQKDFIRSHSAVPQVINAESLTLTRLKVIGNITTSSGINGYDLTSINRTAGDIRNDIIFNTDVAFDQLKSGQMRLQGDLNRQSLPKLRDQAVYFNQAPSITGIKTFKTLVVNGDVNATLVNGRRLIDSYLHINEDQVIDVPIHVDRMTTGDVNFRGKASTLNGVPSGLLFESQTVPYNIHWGDAVFEKPFVNISNLEIPSLQGEDWNELINSLAFLNQTNLFKGTVTFTNTLKVDGVLNATDLNGVDPVAFSEDVVLLDVDAEIQAKKNFETLKVNVLTAPEILCKSVHPDVIRTAAEAVKLDRNDEMVTGSVHFEDLVVKGDVELSTLNGRSFPDGFLMLDGDQDLPSSLVADRVSVLGDIQLLKGARINGLDLDAEIANTWMIDGNQEINSTKTFEGPVIMLKDLFVHQNVNGIPNFAEEVVELSKGGTIYGSPKWVDVEVESNVTGSLGLTNDINVSDLATRAIYLDEPVTTEAKWTVPKVTMIGEDFLMPIESQVNHNPFIVGQLLSRNSSLSDPIKKMVDQKVYDVARHWYEALRTAYFKMDHLDLIQTIFLPHIATSLSEMVINGSSFLFIGTRAGALVYICQDNSTSYSLAGIPSGIGSVSKWLPLNGTDLIVSLSVSTLLSPNITGAKLWQISKEPFRMELMDDFGPDAVDITGEAIHNLRITYDDGRVSVSLPKVHTNATDSKGIQAFERPKSSVPVNPLLSSLFSSNEMVHFFLLSGKQMIVRAFTFSPEITASVVGCPGVRIYSTSTGSMRLEHIIPACDVRAITSFTHGNLPDTYLLLAEHSAVTIYAFEGASGFVERFRLPYPLASALHSWNLSTSGEESLVGVAKEDRVAIHKAITIGDYIRV